MVLCSCALEAQTSLTMTCLGGSTPLTLPITSLYLNLTTSLTTSYFTVTAPFSQLNPMLSNFFFNNSFENCSFSPSNGTSLGTVKISSVSGDVEGSQQYTSVTFSYSVIVIGSTGETKIAVPATPLTAEEQRKALADYLATVPKPSLSAISGK
jgi:hypothetical protein